MKKRKECYNGIFNKIDHIEERLSHIKEQLAELREGFVGVDGTEICLDEIEAEKALLEIMNEAAIGDLLESDPQGDT